MKKAFFFSAIIATMALISCEDNQMENQEPLENSSESTFEKTSSYVDGEKIDIYTDSSGNRMVLKGEEYIPLSSLSDDDGQLYYYLNAELTDCLIFTSKDKIKSIIESPNLYSELANKIKIQDPSMIKTTLSDKGGASTNIGYPSVTIATAHSFGGDTFTKELPGISNYGNPHLRCNQYETDCIDFNDKISSIALSASIYAEFYTGSFQNPGEHLYVSGGLGAVQINNLQSIGWNDKITSFWASHSTYEGYLPIFPGLVACSHNYDDPLCP